MDTQAQDPVLPVVPAYCTSGTWAFLWYLWLAIIYWCGLGGPDRTGMEWGVRRPNRTVLAQSCRCLFAILWKMHVKPNKKVLVSPFHHHSFLRMMTSTGQERVVTPVEGNTLLPPPGYKPSDFDLVVITQMFGRDYDCAWLLDWKKANPNLKVIEDRVQGGLLSKGDTVIPDVSLYSLGQDKIPNAMGGGYAIVHRDNALFERLAAEVEKLPFETHWDRLLFLLKKIPTVAIYNYRAGAWLAERLAHAFGVNRNQLTDGYRKENPGFMHADYLIRPSPAQVRAAKALEQVAHWENMQERCTERYRLFLSFIPKNLQGDVRLMGADTSCCYFFCRLPDLQQSRHHLAHRGIITISNQTYLPSDSSVEHLVANMVTLPVLFLLSDAEVERVASAVVESWKLYGKQH